MLLDEETGCQVANQYVISIRRRWNYENNCAAIICYVSTGGFIACSSFIYRIIFKTKLFSFVGQTTSSTKLTELSDETKKRHQSLTNTLNESHLNEIMKYILSKIMKGYPTTKPDNVPAIHFRIFYQVMDPSPANLIIKSLRAFKEDTTTANIAFTVIPACSLQNYGTFISICGIRHE